MAEPSDEALSHPEKVARAFDSTAPYWRDYYGEQDAVGNERLRVFGETLRAIGAKGLWLDAGCGTGVMARQLRSADLRICGIDTSEALLEEARRLTGLPLLSEASAREEHLCRAPIERTPYAAGHFDGVYSSSVLEYAADLDVALAELRRVVRGGGHLVFNLPNAFSVFRMANAVRQRRSDYFKLVPRWAYWRWEITRSLERSGWQTKSLAYYGSERNAPGFPQFVPDRVRRVFDRQPWAASFVLVVARTR
jgi:SAM-dependent methyltransferase